MASKIKHYTSVEKKIFLDVLKQYKDIIEAEKSDSSTLREKAAAWKEIGCKYNNAFQINDKRTVSQLKKLWTNLKQCQRNALTQERQAAMATGGGPQAPPAKIDPDVTIIALHLLVTAPMHHSTNIPAADLQNDYQIELTEEEDDEGELEYLDVAMLNEMNVCRVNENACSSSLPGTSSSSSQAIQSQLGTPTQVCKKPRVTAKRHRTCTESSSQSSPDKRLKRDTLKMQRIAGIHDHDDAIYNIKQAHASKVAKVKECHLNVINKMREEHLMKIQALELRKATAEAELAELQLSRARENV